MIKHILASGFVTIIGVSAAFADISDTFGPATNPNKTGRDDGPPSGYTAQHWVSADGCTYSRAQAPGYAPTWHLVLNGSRYGLTDAHRDCPMMFTGRR